MGYFQTLALSALAFLVTAAVGVAAGLLDRRAGYDSPWKPLCTVGLVAALALAIWLGVLLMPYITLIALLCIIFGALLLVVGIVAVFIS